MARGVERILKYAVDNSSTLKSMEGAAKIVNLTEGAHFSLPESKYKLQKMFEPIFVHELYYKCEKCNKYTKISSDKAVKEVKCSAAKCGVTIAKKKDNFFVYIPLAPQLRETIKTHFDSIMRYRDRKKMEKVISDVHDGEICKKINTSWPDSMNLTFVMNTDGAQIFESSTKSLWPVLLYQNFLPPRIRFLPDQILVVALFFGSGKPNMSEFLFPLIKELRQLQQSGITVNSVTKDILFRPFISDCACDLPARAAVQMLKQHNGRSACGYCLHPGVSVANDNGNKQIRYIKQDNPDTLRTHQNFVQTTEQAVRKKGSNIDGIKGVSPLFGLNKFDIVHGFAIDYMHCIVIGVTPTLYGLWLDSANSGKPFYINKNKRQALNDRIESIKTPSWISKKPRSIDDSLKANEKRSMLFYYLRSCLPGLLPMKYVDHFQLLSAATYKLSQESITVQEIDEASRMLNRFADEFEDFYGKQYVTLNIHLLRHIADEVKFSGPLWAHSLFGFEAMNGVLVKAVHGTHVLHEITKRYILKKTLACEGPKTKMNFEVKKRGRIFSDMKVEEALHLSNQRVSLDEISRWSAITMRNESYTSIIYKKTKSIDYYIEFLNNVSGIVRFYVVYQSSTYALIEIFATERNIDHLRKVKATGKLSLIPVSEIQEKLMYMSIKNNSFTQCREYSCKMPNKYEKT